MAPPTWVPGQVLSASDVDTWFVPLYAEKTSPFTATTNTTLANDAQMALPLPANAVYVMETFLWYDGGSTGASDLKAFLTGPAGFSYIVQPLYVNSAGNDMERLLQNTGFTFLLGTEGTGVPRAATIKGRVATGGTAGSLQWQFAQATSSGTTTTVHSQSYMMLRRVT